MYFYVYTVVILAILFFFLADLALLCYTPLVRICLYLLLDFLEYPRCSGYIMAYGYGVIGYNHNYNYNGCT